MSLVVAAYNENDIVIGWDDPSTYKDPHIGKAITPPEVVQKVRKINDRLVLMITGYYTSDTVQFMNDFASSAKELFDLDIAFERLSKMAKETLVIHEIDKSWTPKLSDRLRVATSRTTRVTETLAVIVAHAGLASQRTTYAG